MELMSSLLLCTLLAYFPQTLGDSLNKDFRSANTEFNFNISRAYPLKSQKQDNVVNSKGLPLVNSISDLEYVFMDVRCKKCVLCMERAIKIYKTQNGTANKKSNTADAQRNQLENQYQKKHRTKRHAESDAAKKSKTKKKAKSVTVTKYNVGGGVYGLKVKESFVLGTESNNNETSTCRVYSVKKTYDCDSPESEMFLSAAKRKVHKKSKKEKEREKAAMLTTEKVHFIAPSFRKRHVEQSEMPENFEFSIEEMY